MRAALRILVFSIAATVLAWPAAAGELRGRIQLLDRDGRGPARGSDVRQAVVWFVPAGKPPALHPPAAPFQMVTKDKQFVPRLLTVPRGSRVRFPNQDVILHNVFSVSGGNAFDLGFNRQGPGKEKRFDEAGVVRVFCNVHHSMVAYILVLDTPYSAVPEPDGSFVFTGLPDGPGKLTVWHEQTDPWTVDVQVPRQEPVVARLPVVHPQIPPHLNKSGQSYFRSDRDRYNR
jgi:plastocyanin